MCPDFLTSGNFFKAIADVQYKYLLHPSGVLILNEAFQEEASFTLPTITDGYTDANLPFLYLGTNSGSFLYAKPEEYTEDINKFISYYKSYPEIKSSIINSIHGYGNYVAIGTASGVSIISGNRCFNSLNSSNILKTKLINNGCYYCTSGVVYFKQFPISDNWTPIYSLSGTTFPIFSGLILDFDVNNFGIIGLKTEYDTLVIKENLIVPSASQVFNFNNVGFGYDRLYFTNMVTLSGTNLYGSVLLAGPSGIRSVDLNTSGILQDIIYPELEENVVVNLLFL